MLGCDNIFYLTINSYDDRTHNGVHDDLFACAIYWRCSVVAQITTQPQLMVADSNGNHDSGYAPSNVDDVLAGIAEDSSPPDSPVASGTLQRSAVSSRRNTEDASPKGEHATG